MLKVNRNLKLQKVILTQIFRNIAKINKYKKNKDKKATKCYIG
jgi:hypothetical protein